MRDGPVLFVGIPAHGHMIPALALAESLVARGLPVEFLVSEEFADAVRASGARPLAYPTTWPVPAALPVPRTAADALELRAMLAGEAVAQVRTALARAGRRPPRAVVYDTAVGPAARVLTALWGVPGVQVFTGVAASPGFSLAPLLAERYPDLAGLSPPGPDPALVRLAADHGLARDRVAALFAPRERLSLVLQPRAFHQAAETFSPDEFAFVGPCLSRGRARSPWRPPPEAGPVLLVALGTLYNRRPAFYRSCVEAVRGTGWHAVLAVGEGVSPVNWDGSRPTWRSTPAFRSPRCSPAPGSWSATRAWARPWRPSRRACPSWRCPRPPNRTRSRAGSRSWASASGCRPGEPPPTGCVPRSIAWRPTRGHGSGWRGCAPSSVRPEAPTAGRSSSTNTSTEPPRRAHPQAPRSAPIVPGRKA
ncbi:hypothetical protein HFP72_01365 [Nocardiopsis sp. ARC36]